MKLIFLGTGSAFTVGEGNYHSNIILESDTGKHLLIDCGSDARFSLFDQNYSHTDIDALYISHLHADHVGGLEWLAFTTKFDPNSSRPRLYLDHTMSYSLWEHVLSGGLSSLEGAPDKLTYYFDMHEIDEKGIFTWEGIDFTLVQTIHVETVCGKMPSFGLLFTLNQTRIFITTDTQFNPALFPIFDQADLIFHDCETAQIKSGVHATYDQLVELPSNYKNKMWLYHYNPGLLPASTEDGFLGFVKKGQVFSF